MKNSLFKYIFQNHFLSAILLLMIGWLLLEIKDILAAIFISYILMSALIPFVEFLTKKRVPKIIAVFIAYFTTLAFVIIIIFPLIPFFVSQIQSLFNNFPKYLDKAAGIAGFDIDITQIKSFITSELNAIGKSALTLTSKIFSGVFSTLTILVVTFYLLLDHKRFNSGITGLFPKNLQIKVLQTLAKIENKLGAWLRGQVILSFFIGVITWIALTLLGLEFALPLALLAGILEIVPTIGPILAAIPAIIVAVAISPTLALIVVIIYLGIQVLENNILVPKIMQKAVGLNPVVIILSVMIGARLMGVLGALLSIPFISMFIIIVQSFKKED
ncbi:MAG: AI-2E family transporter [Candidatus Levybacteria bacterium]|nr:AI-2E family transporter [Candidatus Levybacteria bacterium]